MNIEFHYYAVYYLAREAGADDAFCRVLARSSQYVDEATTALAVEGPHGRESFEPTQNYVFWDEKVMRDIYLPFHFLPGDPGSASSLRRDGKSNPYAVTPNGSIAKSLVIRAFKDKDPFLMGIALHAFADSWAHQNFSGLMEAWNELPSSSAGALPAAGHLHALAKPDAPDGVWQDGRLVPGSERVVNRGRFLEAAGKIYRYLCVFTGKGFADEEPVLGRLDGLWQRPSREERLADYVIELGVEPWDRKLWLSEAGLPVDDSPLAGIRHYDKLSWAKAELRRALGSQPPVHRVDGRFHSSSLYRWYEASAEHRRRAQAALAGAGL